MAFGVDDAIAAGLKILDKFIPDPELRAKAASELQTALRERNQAQSEINKEYAKSSSIFLAGPRQFLMWACGGAVVYNFILQPLLVGMLSAFGIVANFPALDMKTLFSLLLGMLGLGV